jgi:hypothetical protein
MSEVSKPSKQKLADYLASRHRAKLPPPTPEQIRRELGWKMLPNNKR